MSRSRREYASLALAAAGLVALVVVAVLVFQTGEDKSEPRGLAEPNPATAPAGELATRPDDETAAMSLHDAPRELPDVHFRSDEHTSELQPLMRSSSAVISLKKTTQN